MKPNVAIQEDKYKSYFCSDDGSSVGQKLTIAGTEYNLYGRRGARNAKR